VTPSVAAPGDTNLSDATVAKQHELPLKRSTIIKFTAVMDKFFSKSSTAVQIREFYESHVACKKSAALVLG